MYCFDVIRTKDGKRLVHISGPDEDSCVTEIERCVQDFLDKEKEVKIRRKVGKHWKVEAVAYKLPANW